VDYWVPFPQSEYGGVINVIADDDSEAFELLASEESLPDDYTHLIMPNVIKAEKLNLSDEYQSGIIDAFIT
jgi:hypothetical protein